LLVPENELQCVNVLQVQIAHKLAGLNLIVPLLFRITAGSVISEQTHSVFHPNRTAFQRNRFVTTGIYRLRSQRRSLWTCRLPQIFWEWCRPV